VPTRAERRAVAERCRRLRAALAERGIEALLVTDPAEVRYLSGFTGEDSWLLVGKGRGRVITDGRFAEEVRRLAPGFGATVRRGSLVEALAGVVRRRRLGVVGYDPAKVSVEMLGRLRRAMPGVRLRRAGGMVARLRMRKDPLELAAIRRAVRVAETAWGALRRRIRLGMTEAALAAELDYQMRLAGAEGTAFPTILAIDANAARPHAKPGRRRLHRGAVLLMDFGARVGGYVCDLTRTMFIGRIPPRARRVYETVYAAQQAAIEAVRPGARLVDVDAAARQVIREAGFGRYFGHGLGHGLGLEVHEEPRLGPRSRGGRLEPGMVVTIEPGIYLAGRFGVRIEDDVLVTATGCRVLTRLPKAPDEVVL